MFLIKTFYYVPNKRGSGSKEIVQTEYLWLEKMRKSSKILVLDDHYDNTRKFYPINLEKNPSRHSYVINLQYISIAILYLLVYEQLIY